MSLTVHAILGFQGTQEKLADVLGSVRQACMDLPFKELSKVTKKVIRPSDYKMFRTWQQLCAYPHNSVENLVKRDEAIEMMGFATWEMIVIPDALCAKLMKSHDSVKMVSFRIIIGDGCEYMELHFYEIKKNHWQCRTSTKTQYSEDFVSCHLRVITVLDLLAKAGICLSVTDEGQYWETRDLAILAEKVNAYTALLTDVGKALKAAASPNIRIEMPIDTCKNLVIVKPRM